MAVGDSNRAQMLSKVATSPQARWGWGPSDLASQEEKDAWRALNVGRAIKREQATVADLPEAYGGMPTGTTRRAIRARAAWAQQQEYLAGLAEQQRQMEQAQREERRLSLAEQSEFRQQKSQDLELKKQELLSQREAKIQQEADFIFDTIRGGQKIGINPDGSDKFSEPLRPTDPESFERISSLMGLQYGMENQAAKEAVMILYNDALKTQEALLGKEQKQTEQKQSWLVGQQEEATSVGVDTSKFFSTKVDPQTNETIVTGVDQLGLSKAIGEAKRQDIERKKNEIKEAEVNEEIRSEAKDVLKGIEDVDKQIREQNFMASREESEKNRDEYLARAQYLRQERDVLVTRYNNLIPKKQEEAQPQQRAPQPQKRELTAQDQAALNWANANPNDPRSQRIKAKLGVQ